MSQQQLLMIVQVSCEPEHLDGFTRWYNNHLPNLLRIPGYLWAQRYVGIDDRTRFTAIYGIRSADDLPTLLQFDGPHVHSIARSEKYEGWDKLQGLGNRLANVYTQMMGPPLRDPFISSDRSLRVVTTNVDPAREEEWNEWYSRSHIPNLLKVRGYAMAARFRMFDHPSLARFNSGPRYLTIYECESDEAVASLRPGPAMAEDARLESEYARDRWRPYMTDFSSGFYRMIAKHFKWQEA